MIYGIACLEDMDVYILMQRIAAMKVDHPGAVDVDDG